MPPSFCLARSRSLVISHSEFLFNSQSMQQYLITILILLPTLGAVAAIGHNFVSYKRETHYRWIALAFSVATFALSLLLLGSAENTTADGFQFVQNVPWINAIGARYHIGLDGISLWLVLLTTLLVPISILSSWTSITKRTLSYYEIGRASCR